jgi:hypothetical protein
LVGRCDMRGFFGLSKYVKPRWYPKQLPINVAERVKAIYRPTADAITADPLETATLAVPRLEEAFDGVVRDIVPELRQADSNSQILLTNWAGRFQGKHEYLFAYRVMPRPKDKFVKVDKKKRIMDSFYNVMAGPSTVVSEDIHEVHTSFSTGDQIGLRKSLSFYLAGIGYDATGETAITKYHALNGHLSHVNLELDQRFTCRVPRGISPLHDQECYMVRQGSGHYPIPGLNIIIDGTNPILGSRIWQLTDWAQDLRINGRDKFLEFYGREALDDLLSLLEANSCEWALRKQDSFLGMGDDVFLGDEHGSHGALMQYTMNLGFAPRLAQGVYFSLAKMLQKLATADVWRER